MVAVSHTTMVWVVVGGDVDASLVVVVLRVLVDLPAVPDGPAPADHEHNQDALEEGQPELRAAEAVVLAVSSDVGTEGGEEDVADQDDDAPRLGHWVLKFVTHNKFILFINYKNQSTSI